ncbi:MAG: YhbY family RNA-binding protein [bacterium]|nr:YhbY family RNA-binding protein [bacterium]
MVKIKGSDRKYLRGLAHVLKPVVFIGKGGVTAGVIDSMNEALDQHELIKVRFVEFKEERKTLAGEIAERSECEQVGMIGHVAIFFRAHPNEEKRKIQLP